VQKDESQKIYKLDKSDAESFQVERKKVATTKSLFQDIVELNIALDLNGSVVLSTFKPSSDVPHLTLYEEVFKNLVYQINQKDRNTYELVGHTNSQGNAISNKNLSVQRVRRTLEILVNDYSLDLSKMKAIGEGESNPIQDNATNEGRRMNSRVELRKLN